MSIRSKTGVLIGALFWGLPITFFLEVVGASGAVWGGSDLVGVRNDENEKSWAIFSMALGTLAFIRYSLKFYRETPNLEPHEESFAAAFSHAVDAPMEAIKEEFFERQEEKNQLVDEGNSTNPYKSKAGILVGILFGISTMIALEVVGASGAAWGGSEAFGLRDANNKEFWVPIAITLGALAAGRYALKFYRETPNPERREKSFIGALGHVVVEPHEAVADQFYIQEESPRENMERSYGSKAGALVGALFCGFPVSFFLEVVGASGATWGGSEAFGLRDANNKEFWVPIAMTLGALAAGRYALKFYREAANLERSKSSFIDAFWHAVDAPREAIKDQFFKLQKVVGEDLGF